MRYSPQAINIYWLLLISFFATNCSTDPSQLPVHIEEQSLENLTVYSPDDPYPYNIALSKELVYNEDQEVIVSRFTDVEIDDNGRLYIADAQKLNIKVFDVDGNYLTTLGRDGSGPGEFRDLNSIQIRNDRLYAHDRRQQVAVVYSTHTFQNLSTVILAGNKDRYSELDEAFPSSFHVRSDSTLVQSFVKPNHRENLRDWDSISSSRLFFLLDDEGDIRSSKLLEKKSRIEVIIPTGGPLTIGRPVSMLGTGLIANADDHRFFTAWSRDFLFSVYDGTGEYRSSFYYPYEAVPLTVESASEAGVSQLIIDNMESLQLPPNWPALNSVLVDDENRLWISTIIDDMDVYQWWVLEDSGKMITRFEWPRDKQILKIRNGALFALTRDVMGSSSVVKYRIELERI